MKRTLRATAVALALMSLAAPRVASAGPFSGRPGRGKPLQAIASLLRALELTDSQKSEIRLVLRGHEARLTALLSAERETRSALVAAIRRPVAEPSLVREASAAVARVDADLAVERAVIFSEIHTILTPAQRVELRSALDGWHAALGERLDAVVTLVRAVL
jgi:Spy/CpxP family protein refolding chaperone